MYVKQSSPKNSKMTLLTWLLVLVVLAACFMLVIRPLFYLLGINLGETFHFTFSVTDLDQDGDWDVWVNGRRNEQEFVAFAGANVEINQGGLQGGQTGKLISLSSERGGWDSTTADLDGDGDPDALSYGGFDLFLSFNQGGEQGGQAGAFPWVFAISPPVQDEKYNLVTQFGSIITGDVNNDGRIDALVLGCCGRPITYAGGPGGTELPNVSWVWFNEMGDFGLIGRQVAALEALEGLPVAQAALADLEGDQDLDLFAVILESRNGPGPTSVVLLNDGSGNFNDSGQRLNGKGSSSVALGDLDDDGDLDALVGIDRGAVVLINQGGIQGGKEGRFSASNSDIAGSQTRTVRLGDLDSDGDLDALVVGKREAALWWNDGQGQFTKGVQSFPCSKQQDLTIGDFNGDGHQDIYVAQYAQSSQVWFNHGEEGFRPDR